MAFDEERYAQDFIKKLRRARSLPDDLLERYAITLPASDQVIAEQVKAVRAYWNKLSSGSSHSAQTAKLCRAEDERLRGQYGPDMETVRWWQARQADRQSRAQASITALAEDLKQGYGQLGVVPSSIVEGLSAKLSLSRADVGQALKQAGLTQVEGITLPSSDPFAGFGALVKSMSQGAVASVPELVHPGAGPFRLFDRYVCTGTPSLRLDAVAVDAQIHEFSKLGPSTTGDARRSALSILRRALKEGVDLRDVALYHLVTLATEYVALSKGIALGKLQEAGLDRHDAAVITVLLSQQASASGNVGVSQVRNLLTAGRLNEAAQAAQGLPADSADRQDVLNEVEANRKHLNALLGQTQQAAGAFDEVQAETLLREAAAISAEDAEVALKAIPLPPPAGLRAVSDGSVVKLFWQPAPGHDQSVRYEVARAENRPPAAASDGSPVYQGQASECTDSHAPVARAVQYGVFARGDGRPDSRAAAVVTTLLPPVSQLQADLGPSEITLHWSADPAVDKVRVLRLVPGAAPVPLPVRGNNCFLSGLTEGEKLNFEVTAIYLGPDGTELPSAAVPVSATPRSEAQPIPRLRVRPVEAGGAVRIRVAWKPVDSSEVRILRSDTPPSWQFGTWVRPEDMARFGQELTGHRFTGRAEVAIEAELPPGVHYLVPFSVGGTGIVMGQPTPVGVTDPVRHLVVTPFASYATASWEWPPSAQLAEVSWACDGNADCMVLGEAEYRTQGGAKVPLGRGPSTIEVRAMILADGVSYSSPPVQQVVSSAGEAEISYSVAASAAIGPFGGRSKKVTFRSAEGCAGVHVQMVAQPGRVMPDSARAGQVILDTTLALPPGMPSEHQVTVPRAVKRPYWVRCFVVDGQARLVDPPISSLKET